MITLVLLPGMDGTGSLFAPFIAALGSEFNVKVVSYPTTEPLGYPELESIVRAVLPVEGPFVILGESFSGPIAVSLAASSPAGLKGLVLCGTFVRNPRPVLSLFKSLVGVIPIAAFPIRVLSYFLLGRYSNDSIREALKYALNQVSSAVLRARLRAVLSVNVSGKITEVRVPVLILRASQDRLVPESAANLISQFCPSAKMVSLEGPHFLLQVAPDEAARVVSNFVRERDK